MLYAVRSERRRQGLQRAKIHLKLKFRKTIITRLRRQKYKMQPRRPSKYRVTFTNHHQVVRFDANKPPALMMNHRLGSIDKLSERFIRHDCSTDLSDANKKSLKDLRALTRTRWISDINRFLCSRGFQTFRVPEEKLDCFYDLSISILRATILLLSGSEMVPRSLSLDELKAFMRDHSIVIPTNADLFYCFRAVETYLLDHQEPFTYPKLDLCVRKASLQDIVFYHTFIGHQTKFMRFMKQSGEKYRKGHQEETSSVLLSHFLMKMCEMTMKAFDVPVLPKKPLHEQMLYFIDCLHAKGIEIPEDCW